jgi:hypothetical protein
MAAALRCINEDDGQCEGEVRMRERFAGALHPYPRCEAHYGERLDLDERLRTDYPVLAPRDFDPSYAGERWNEDDL